MRALLARWWVTLAVLLFLLGYFGWWRVFPDPLTRLFQALPPDQGIYLYADVKGLRSAPVLRALLDSPESPLGAYRSLMGEAGFLEASETDGLALSMSGRHVRFVAYGTISQSRLRTYVEQRGGNCEETLPRETCRFSAGTPAREITLKMLDEDLLSVSYLAGPEDAGDHSTEGAGDLAPLVRAQILDGALLWCALRPSRIDEIAAALPPGAVNLAFFARALENAERAYLWIEQEDVAGSFSLLLAAETASPDDAAELNGLLLSLNRFAAAAADTGRGESPSEWGQVLRSGEFAQVEETVQAIWSLDSVLRRSPEGSHGNR